jgi:hypothetical protein
VKFVACVDALKTRRVNTSADWCKYDSQGHVASPESALERFNSGGFFKVASKPKFNIKRAEKVYTIGSCFAREIERALVSEGIDVPTSRIAIDSTFYRSPTRYGNTVLIPKHQTRWSGFDDKILSLYARGMTVREIQSHLEEMYGTEVSPTLISSVTDAVVDEVKAWQGRALDSVYPIVYLDCIHAKVRDSGAVRAKAVYLALGIDMDGNKQVLGLWYQSHSSRYQGRLGRAGPGCDLHQFRQF